MPDNYTVLASIYDDVGMSAFSRQMVERMLDFALANDWLGTDITDFGCGTGVAAGWLAEDRFNITGIDHNEQMLEVARARSNLARWEQADIRSISEDMGKTDMVFAFDVINEMESVKDATSAFTSAFTLLRENGLFLFDIYTLKGLSERGLAGARVVHDGDGAIMFAQNAYDYERMVATRSHVTFIQSKDGTWLRQDTVRIVRGFPIQALAALLQRVGFNNVTILDTNLQHANQRQFDYDRVVFVARK
jgi:predicted TPR repeat methyltransferase